MINDTVELSFEIIEEIKPKVDVTVRHTYQLRDYMSGTPIFEILLDWLESFDVGDVFVSMNTDYPTVPLQDVLLDTGAEMATDFIVTGDFASSVDGK